VIYRINGDEVEILGVRLGARRLGDILSKSLPLGC